MSAAKNLNHFESKTQPRLKLVGRASHYDPETGRWTSKDPILFNGPLTGFNQRNGYNMADAFVEAGLHGMSGLEAAYYAGLYSETNLYGYSFSDPVNFIDSNGEWAVPVIRFIAKRILGSIFKRIDLQPDPTADKPPRPINYNCNPLYATCQPPQPPPRCR